MRRMVTVPGFIRDVAAGIDTGHAIRLGLDVPTYRWATPEQADAGSDVGPEGRTQRVRPVRHRRTGR